MPPKAEKKICMVPACEASSTEYPDRIFVSVPENKKREWLAMVGAESVYIHPTKRFFCCEEHFDVRRDIKDYDFFKLFGGRVKFEDHAYPFKNLGDVPEVTPPTIVTDGKRNTTDIYFPAPLPVTVVEDQPIADSDQKTKAESNLWKEQRDEDEDIVFVDPLFTSEEPLEHIASNIKVDEDESMFDVTESKFDPTQITWPDAVPVKPEDIVIKSELQIKEEPAELIEDVRYDSSETDFSDGDDEDFVYEKPKRSSKVKNDDNEYEDDDDDDDDEEDDDDEDEKPAGGDNDSTSFDNDSYIPKNTSYKCLKCNNYYSSSSSLKRHEQTVHTEDKDKIRKTKKPKPKPFKCDVCKKPFETLFRKNRHLVTHEEGRVRIIACRQCPERFTEYEEYQRHKVVHNKSFECDVCHKSFTTKYFLKLHYPIHMETKPFQCDRCSRSFSQASTLRRHTYLHEAEKRFMCEICGKRFHAQFLVKMHILHTHSKVRNFMCSQCPKRFPSTTALNIHINVHHSDVNPYKCAVCEKTFNHPSALMRHRKLHTGICEFVCEHCNKRFVRSDHLKKHITDVHSEKSFKCELCSFTFNKAEKLKKHARTHEKPVVKRVLERCTECHQPFTDHNKLLRHLEMFHNPSNPFRCDICLKRFSQQSALGRHMKLHTDQKKSFKCTECEKTFCRLDHIKTHTLTLHNPDNPYKCGTCRQTFSTQQSLEKHIVRAHETERTMLCEFCNKAFSKRYTLQRHIRNFHDSDSGGGGGAVVVGDSSENYVHVLLNDQMISN